MWLTGYTRTDQILTMNLQNANSTRCKDLGLHHTLPFLPLCRLKQIELDRTLEASYKEIFTRPSYRKRAVITVTLLFCVMSSGILVIQNYGVIIFGRLGYNNLQVSIISKQKRRPLM